MDGYYSNLNEVLEFREKIYIIQKNFLKETKQGCIISFGMNIPGPVKVNFQICQAYRLGRKEVIQKIREMGLEIRKSTSVEIRSGLAAVYLLGSSDARYIKQEMVKLEDNHPLGRLFDVDVIEKNGNAVSRIQLGVPPRRCLLCGKEAKICSRSRKHSVEELQQVVCSILNQKIGGKQIESGEQFFS